MLSMRSVLVTVAVCGIAAVVCLSGCGTLDKAYNQEVTWADTPTIHVFTNTVVVTNTLPIVTERTNVVYVTNATSGAVSGFATREPVVTNFVTVTATNLVPVFGSIVALALGGLYHGYRQVRNRKVNEALIQGVETARAVLTTTPQGKAADAQLVKWLMDHQQEAGVLSTVSDLVGSLADNPAARMTAQEIAQRVQQAQQQRTAGQAVAA